VPILKSWLWQKYRENSFDHTFSDCDGDQEEEENEAEVQNSQRHISSSSFLPQRITRSKAKELGSRLQMFSLFIVSFV